MESSIGREDREVILGSAPIAAVSAPFAPLTFDALEFMQFVEDENLTQAEAEQLLRAIWDIAVAFVDLAFGIHPTQQTVDGFGRGDGSASPGVGPVLSYTDVFSITASNEIADRATRETAAEEES